MLERHKKKGFEGFKHFVRFLETVSTQRRKDIIESAILEDPVYMVWVIKNMISVDYLLSMDSKEVEAYFNNCPNLLEVMAKAMLEHPLKNKIMDEFLPGQKKKEFIELSEIFKEVPKPAQLSAQYFLLERVRVLQESGSIHEYNWKLPPHHVACEEINPIRNGLFKREYDNGQLALEGKIELTKRIGRWKHYYINGQLMAEGAYRKGQKTGEWTFFYANGKIKSRGDFFEDRKNDNWIEVDPDGNENTVKYQMGKVIES